MAFQVRTTAQADEDADSILTWLVSQGAGESAIRWYVALADAIASLSEFPQRCVLAPEDSEFPFEVRLLLYGRKPHVYRILFTIEEDLVYILHIRHGTRLPLAKH